MIFKASRRWHLIQKVLDVIDSGAETNRVWVLAIKIAVRVATSMSATICRPS